MSIINQMLRDLDARGAASSSPPAGDFRVAPNSGRPVLRKAALLFLVLSFAGIAGYFALLSTPNPGKPSAEAVVEKRQPAPIPVVITSPPVRDEPDFLAKPSPSAQDTTQEPILSKQASPLILGTKLSRSLLAPQSVAPGNAITRAPAQIEAAMVKEAAEMSPEAEALQLYDDAQTLRRSGKVDAAMGKYRLALERNPGMRNARIRLAGLMQETDQPDAAMSLLREGYDLQPDGGLAIAIGRLFAEQRQRDEALIWLEHGRDSLRPSDHALMGALLSQALRHEEAVKSYQRALAVEPSQGGWLLGLGLALESLGRTDAAQTAYRNALDRGDFKPEVVKFLRHKTGAMASVTQ